MPKIMDRRVSQAKPGTSTNHGSPATNCGR